MLWIWDEDEVDRLLGEAGARQDLGQRVAETLYLPWPSDGTSIRRCAQSEELLTCESGALTSARLGSPRPFAGEVIQPRMQGWNWATDWMVSDPLARMGGGVGLFNRVASLAALSALGWTAHQGTGLWAAERVALSLETTVAEGVGRTQQSAGRRSDSSADMQWLQAYERLTIQLDVEGLVESLRPVLERHGAVIREWNSMSDRVDLMLVSAGGDFRLPQLIEELGRVQGVTDLQLLEHEELLAVKVSFQAPGWLRHGLDASVQSRVRSAP